MSLRSTVIAVLAGVLVILLAVDAAILNLVVFRGFDELEREQARQNMQRVVNTIETQRNFLDAMVFDWAAWDDTYEFVVDQDPEYVESNLLLGIYEGLDINLLIIFDRDGKVVWGEVFDLETGEPIGVSDFPEDGLPPAHPLLAHETTESSITGLYKTERGPMLLSSRPIITSDEEGPIRGTLIMGRFFNEAAVTSLGEQIEVTLRALPLSQAVLDSITPDSPFYLGAEHDGLLPVFVVLRDIHEQTILMLRVDHPMAVTAVGADTTRFAFASLVLAGVAVMVVMLVLLQRVIVGPLTDITRQINTLRETNNLTARLCFDRKDEIGILAHEFNTLLDRLTRAREELVETSYLAGMAVMAEGALHNIGNMLTPVVVRIGRMRDKLGGEAFSRLETALVELSEKATPAERKGKLVEYVCRGTERLIEHQQSFADDLDTVADQADEIIRILSTQRELIRARRITERLELVPVLEEAIGLVAEDLRQSGSIGIDTSVAEVGPVNAQGVLLVQVLANLLVNAAESIQKAGAEANRIEAKAAQEQVDGEEVIHLTLCDNGTGIDPDDLVTIFQRDFSAKPIGQGGKGLHWCANVVAGMNGRLYAENREPGQGTCLHILLPAAGQEMLQ